MRGNIVNWLQLTIFISRGNGQTFVPHLKRERGDIAAVKYWRVSTRPETINNISRKYIFDTFMSFKDELKLK